MRNYTLNPDHARQADSGGLRITETGAYVGKFNRAEAIKSKKDTDGIEFSFESDGGLKTNYLTLWTHNVNGDEIFGIKTLNAVMTCAKVRNISPRQCQVEKYDLDSKKNIQVTATIYPDLMNKQIGVVLQKEEYAPGKFKFNIVGAFDPITRMTASEILDKKVVPERLNKILPTIKDKLLSVQAGQQADNKQPDNFDDDIPW